MIGQIVLGEFDWLITRHGKAKLGVSGWRYFTINPSFLTMPPAQ
ncbi:MAG: hypothetical protein WCT16_03860 [Candidatus Buchananbacteria bacterium]